MMECPKCGEKALQIDVTFSGTVDIQVSEDGEDFEVMDSEPGDSEWTDESGVRCDECGHDSTVKECKEAWKKRTDCAENDECYFITKGRKDSGYYCTTHQRNNPGMYCQDGENE